MEDKTKEKWAKVNGDHGSEDIWQAQKLLREAGFRVFSAAVSGITLEVMCFEGKTLMGEFRDLKDLEEFLKANA